MLRIGSTGTSVVELQELISIATSNAMLLDGIFGPNTERAVKQFQSQNGLVPDGIVGPRTMQVLSKYKPSEKFAVFVDAGHGDYHNGVNYTPARMGKKYQHKNIPGHDGNGWFYEGHENRIAANDFCARIRCLGFVAVKTYEPQNDTALSTRTAIVRSWANRGWTGYLHSFHSNAIDTSLPKSKLENTRGFLCFTTIGQNDSDKIASAHFEHVQEVFGKDWIYRSDMSDGDVDYEANFAVIRDTDKSPDRFAAFLEEWGFFTSSIDTAFIMQPDTRLKRVDCAVKTYHFAKELLINNLKPKPKPRRKNKK